MFVKIEDFKSAIAVENILTPYKKGRLSQDKKTRLPKEKITPDVCMKILHSTNYARNIKDMLLCIAELPQSEQAQFKDVILAVFDNREQPESIQTLGEELVRANGLDEDFKKIKRFKAGDYYLSRPNFERMWATADNCFEHKDLQSYEGCICLGNGEFDIYNLANNHLYVPQMYLVPDGADLRFKYLQLEKDKKYTVKGKGTVELQYSPSLPEVMDVSDCDKIIVTEENLQKFEKWSYRPEALTLLKEQERLAGVLDYSGWKAVQFRSCNFDDVSELKFGEDMSVHFSGQKKIPDNLAFSKCRRIVLYSCDLSNQNNLNFKEGAKVYLRQVTNVPQDIDFANCSKVYCDDCNFVEQKPLHFKEGAKVHFSYCFPYESDLSGCSEVLLENIRFPRDYKLNLKLKDGAKVHFSYCFPYESDLSGCSEVVLENILFHRDYKLNLKLKDGAKVKLAYLNNVELSNIDFSKCDEVFIRHCDSEGTSLMKFKDGAKVALESFRHYCPIDFSNCDEVSLEDISLKNKPHFKNGAKVKLRSMYVSDEMDVSGCDEVEFNRCGASSDAVLKFKKGADVVFDYCQSFAAQVDFSQCNRLKVLNSKLRGYNGTLDFSNCEVLKLKNVDVYQTERVVFKNRKQMRESGFSKPDDWMGQIVFQDEQTPEKMNFAMMAATTKGGR